MAIDYTTMDIVAHLVAPAENQEHYTSLVEMVKACGYVIQAIISDGCPGILALTKPKRRLTRKGTRRYPRPGITPAVIRNPPLVGIPHQWCVVHAQREAERKLLGLPQAKQAARMLIHRCLFATSLKQAETAKWQLLQAAYKHPTLYGETARFIILRWPLLTTHFTVRVNRRKIPKDTNTAENTISYLNTRLKTMRRLRTTSSATAITRLITINFRTKPLINTKNKLKRGKSPLALAMGKNLKFDWMEFIQKSTA